MEQKPVQKRYSELKKRLFRRGDGREDPSIANTREALDALGNPEEDCRVVLIGGTNGKGSVAEMVSELLQQQGLDVGVYKSPHLVSVRERIKVNGEEVSRREFVELYREVEELDIELSFFETLTVMAYLHFSGEVDCAVMEVGMGGRLDATNAAEAEVAVITNVGLDHTRYLGDTREEIAREKAGIIPRDGHLVTRSQLDVIEEAAEARDTEILRPASVRRRNDSLVYRGQRFTLPVEGGFQEQNLEDALKTVEVLEETPADLEAALTGLECPGRMETVSEEPLYIHDGAHNPAALEKAVEDFPDDFTCVFNALRYKDIASMVEIIERKASKFYLTKSDAPWAAEPGNIAEHIDIPHETVTEPRKAVEMAKDDAGENGAVVVTGSLYLIGKVREEDGDTF